MDSGHRRQQRGFTLVEILVVVGIIALISAVAIPGLVRLGAFSRDEFKRTVNEVDSLLRAAQIYSQTYNVNTAVVYNMDNYSRAEAQDSTVDEPITEPIVDTYTGTAVRQIEAAAIMYRLPTTMGAVSTRYVPVPGDLGDFRPLPEGMSIMLQNPEVNDGVRYEPFYLEFSFSNYRPSATVDQIGALGMRSVSAALGLPVGMTNAEFITFVNDPANYTIVDFPAHVFTPGGRIDVAGGFTRERFTLYIAPSADRPIDDRVVNLELSPPDLNDTNGQSNLRYRKIHVHRSTARISVPADF